MSENLPQGGAPADNAAADPINNVKAEFGRKIGNVEAQMAQLAQTNQQLLAQIQQIATSKAPAVPEADIEDLWYKDPRKAKEMIQRETEERIDAKLTQRQQEMTRQNATIASLVKDFPELNDENNALTKRAVELYTKMDDYEKKSPTAYKLAVKEAALELDVKPLSKRVQNDTDSYSMGGNSTPSEGRPSRGSKRDQVAPETLQFAKLMGLNTDDPKVIESLKSRSQRKNWNRFE